MKKRKLGRKLLSFLLTMAMVVGLMPGMGLTVHAGSAEEIDEHGIIIKPPDGGNRTPYKCTGNVYYASNGQVYSEEQTGRATLVEFNDGTVYLTNPVFNYQQSAWIKGTRTENTISFPVNQPVSYNSSYNTTWSVRWIGGNSGSVAQTLDIDTINFVIDDEAKTLALQDSNSQKFIGIAWDDDNSFTGFGAYNVTYTYSEESSLEPVTVPDGIVFSEWEESGNTSNGTYYSTAKVAISGEDVYIGNFNQYFPDAVIKGKLEGNTVTFDSFQYIGEYSDYHIWVVGQNINDTQNSLSDSFTMTYDEENGILTLDEDYRILLNANDTSVYYLSYFETLEFSKPGSHSAISLNEEYVNEFDDFAQQKQFKFINANGDDRTWNYYNGMARYTYSSQNAADDWIVSPAFNLEAGKKYAFSIQTHAMSQAYPERLEVKIAREGTAEALAGGAEVIAPTDITSAQFITLNNDELTVAETGEYYIGVHGISDADKYYLYVDNFKLRAAHTHDFTYAADGATITATCTAEGCTLPPSSEGGTDHVATLTIAAPALTTYGGSESAEVTITDANNIKGDAAVVYKKGTEPLASAPTDAGTYTASITLGDGENAATASVEYTIAKADPTATAPTATATYGQTLADVTLPDGWTWADSTQSVGSVVSPAATFKANFAGNDNYEAASNVEVTVTVGKANPTAPTGLTATYGQTLANVTLPDGWTWADSTQSVGNVVDPAATFKANFAGNDNYNAASNVEVTVTVGKANAVAATVTANNRTYDGTEKPLVTVAGETIGGTLKIAVTTVDQEPDDGAYTFDTTSIPAKTDAGTYYVYYKVIGDDNHEDTEAGFITVDIAKATATVETAPEAVENLEYSGEDQNLITAGETDDETFVYALGEDAENAPEDNTFSSDIPTGKASGTYYVYYKKLGDDNHEDSQPVCITVMIAPAYAVITKDPSDAKVIRGSRVTFRIAATGENVTYRWETSKDNGETWVKSNADGADTDKIVFKATESLDGRLYRCVAITDAGEVFSASAQLTTLPVISSQTGNAAAAIGSVASFTVKARSSVAKYQWQVSLDGGATWKKSGSEGAETATLNITVYGAKYNGYLFRCKVTNGTWTEYSKEVKLSVKTAIVKQPEDVSEYYGNLVKLYVKATGVNPQYQWQVKNASGKWVNSTSAGNNTNILAFTSRASLDGRQFRCKITDENGTLYSNIITFTAVKK